MKSGYFSELAFHLRQEGFTVLAEEDGVLPVEWNGKPLYRVTEAGGIRYRQQDMAELDMVLALNRATDIASMTLEYMALMTDAHSLKADSLGENYKLLADFNGAVLAGHPTEYGVQFVTWEWSYGRTGLWQGHAHHRQSRRCGMMHAVLRNAQHPEYGTVTIPLPISNEDYDDCIKLLASLEIGDPVQRDCMVDELQCDLHVLKRLEKTRSIWTNWITWPSGWTASRGRKKLSSRERRRRSTG